MKCLTLLMYVASKLNDKYNAATLLLFDIKTWSIKHQETM